MRARPCIMVSEKARRSGLDKMHERNKDGTISRRHGGRGVMPDEDRIYDADQIEFMMAVDRYKRDNHRPNPAWSEVLEVLRGLGYRKVAPPVDP